jgi:hypothetical protein
MSQTQIKKAMNRVEKMQHRVSGGYSSKMSHSPNRSEIHLSIYIISESSLLWMDIFAYDSITKTLHSARHGTQKDISKFKTHNDHKPRVQHFFFFLITMNVRN